MTTAIRRLRAAVSLAAVAAASGILGDDHVDPMLPEQPFLVFQRKWAARRDDRRVARQEVGRRRIDAANDVAVRHRIPERGEVLAADGEKHPPRLLSQRIRGGLHVRHADPAVAGNLLPGRAHYGETGDRGGGRGGDGIRGDNGRKGMGGVHHDADPVPAEIVREPFRAAEPADPGVERRGFGRSSHAGERQDSFETVVPGDQSRQRAGLRRPAEQEDFQS